MKKIISLVMFVFLINITVKAQLNESQIKYGKFYTAASDKTLEKQGGIYKDLVVATKFFRLNGYSNDYRFSFKAPSGISDNLRDFVSVNPSSTYNRSFSYNGVNGIFLNPLDRNHYTVTILSTGEEFIVGCLNKVIHKDFVTINKYGTSSTGITSTTGVTGTTNIIVNPCNCPDDKNWKPLKDANTGWVNIPSRPALDMKVQPNRNQNYNFDYDSYKKDDNKQKTWFGRNWGYVAGGIATAYILADGFTDGEWFDFNFKKEKTTTSGGWDHLPSSTAKSGFKVNVSPTGVGGGTSFGVGYGISF